MTLPGFLEFEPGTDFVRLTGHRIGLAEVVRLYEKGHSAEMIAAYFPTLPLSLVYSVLSFYLDNKHDVELYVANDDAELHTQEAESRKNRPAPTFEELRHRFNVMRPSGS